MAPKAVEEKKMVGLPVSVARPVDVGRLLNELEKLDDHMLQDHLRHKDDKDLPRLSRFMEQTADLNKIDLADEHERKLLMKFLEGIKAKSPVLHMSFSADPSPAFIEKLMAWLRREVHPLVLVTVGLQPTLGAGCIVRSTNKYFDMSLRQDFTRKRDLLRQSIIEKVSAPISEKPAGPTPISTDGPVEMPVSVPVQAAAPAAPAASAAVVPEAPARPAAPASQEVHA